MNNKYRILLCAAAAIGIVVGCRQTASPPSTPLNARSAADAVYVQPGTYDEYYMFASGGHSGQVYVTGIPSMRRIRTLAVFTPDPATGYGFDDQSKKMLGKYSWGDVHHPSLSETNGEYDGRWLFVNDTANNRVARIDLTDFKVKQILGPLPNIMGPHCAAFVTPNSEYFIMPTRFSVPMNSEYAPLSEYSRKYSGAMAAVSIDPKDGTMKLAWEMKLPPWNYDLSDSGKGPSGDWGFLTTYNTEEFNQDGKEPLESGSSANETDYILAINWRETEKAVKAGRGVRQIGGATVIDPAEVPGLVYLVPCPKNPHGVDVTPDGKYFIGSGKEAPVVTVYSFDKMLKAIADNSVETTVRGLPVLKLDAVRETEIEVGLGPLHTQFDSEGHAYTSLFIESAVVKWKVGTWQIVDKTPVYYSIGHLAVAEGDSASPDGKYLVALNKIAKDRFLNVGPSHPESMQLIDIASEKMRTLIEVPIDPEPHYAQIIKADKIKPIVVYDKKTVKDLRAVWSPEKARVVRRGNKVDAYVMAVRSHFVPQKLEVNEGDDVTIHLTNVDQDRDTTHGLAIPLYNLDMQVDPGEVRSMSFKADKSGVYPIYCSNFCSALHQEMQGYLLVKPSGQASR